MEKIMAKNLKMKNKTKQKNYDTDSRSLTNPNRNGVGGREGEIAKKKKNYV